MWMCILHETHALRLDDSIARKDQTDVEVKYLLIGGGSRDDHSRLNLGERAKGGVDKSPVSYSSMK
jgi:hypothetical protein